MSDKNIDLLYLEGEEWKNSLNEKTVHAKRMKGKFRNIKWASMLVWLPFFTFAYIPWDGRQAILFDVENRQYHLFNITIFPQDIWMLAMVLLFLAILLAAITTLLGRVFCGYFCFQTVWTDIYTWFENLIEGPPTKRRKLEQEGWSLNKISLKITKHLVWFIIAFVSAVTWMLYFGVTWGDYFSGNLSSTTISITASITAGAYIFAGHLREQSCLWVCPYARIQGVMTDKQSIMPTYDYLRGEPRGKLTKGSTKDGNGDCIDCAQCVAVCPTGVDIRHGQEYGCITCGLCIDACDSVMDKINKPRGLIRYTSLDEMRYNKPAMAFYKRPRVIVYSSILVIALSILTYGLFNIAPVEFNVLHDRQPLFVQLSDGSIRNKYEIKLLNKTHKDQIVSINFESKIKNLKSQNALQSIPLKNGVPKSVFIYLSAFEKDIGNEQEVTFIIEGEGISKKYTSSFFSP